MKKNIFITLTVSILSLNVVAQKNFTLKSPDGKIETGVLVNKTICYHVSHEGDLMLDKSQISMKLNDGTVWGVEAKLSGVPQTKTINATIDAPVYKRKQIKDNYNELTLKFKGDYMLIFRAYNDGIAYRFVSTTKKTFIVENEQAEFNFPTDSKIYVTYTNKSEDTPLDLQFENSFEQPYHNIKISEWNKKRYGQTPVVVEGANGKKICITDADMLNYPGMFMYPTEKPNVLKAVFAPYVSKEEQSQQGNAAHVSVIEREKYIAKYDGATTFPWRAIVISEKDTQLADNDMVYRLATPSKGDFSWVKPGKVAWDWWNDWNLYGVDFKTGVNNETYKYYIDFASKYEIEYVILDDGWSDGKKADLFFVVPAINLPDLVAYAQSKNVEIILWAGYSAFGKDMESICKHYSEMGIKGFKVDFMDRDDQRVVNFHYRAAEIAARYKLLLDFHGTYKPTGLQRTYPNVINFEAVHGLEQLKWNARDDQVTHDVIIPFIRQVAGPMDYTQGAMRNATKNNYRAVYNEPMSQGTRSRQLAEYVIFESPLSMLCDAPTNYMAEPECTEYISKVPTVWDNTIALNGEIGKYVTIARQKGDVWYVGSMTNWDARELEIDLSFLGEGSFKGEVFRDGVNARRTARDYKKETIDIAANRKLKIAMAPGGGYVVVISRK
ncbi:MAG: glycoside hydrolase family 97 protein [Tannerella sp.]|nr:glycoside hydrolase family 97 protein [Tannerella sp.]